MVGIVEVIEVREDERLTAELTKRMLAWIFTFAF
jgi:hypothetical protein